MLPFKVIFNRFIRFIQCLLLVQNQYEVFYGSVEMQVYLVGVQVLVYKQLLELLYLRSLLRDAKNVHQRCYPQW